MCPAHPHSAPRTKHPSAAARVLLGAVALYRVLLSPLIGRQCRYLPTCSDYAAEALRRHGAWQGAWMTLARLARCNPLGPSGFDPVPPHAGAPWYAPWRAGRWTGAHMDPATRLDERG